MPAPRRALLAASAGLLALTSVLSACSNSEAPVNRTPNSGSATASEVAGKQTVTLSVGNDYRFHPSTIYVHPGQVTIVLKYTGTGAPHNFQLENLTGIDIPGAFVPQVSLGRPEQSATFMAPAVSKTPYEFVCTFHIQQGQIGKMYVRNP